MRLARILELLDCRTVFDGGRAGDVVVEGCYAADLMSDVLAYSHSGGLLITGLASVQAVHAAHLADFLAIVFVSNKSPAPDALDLARRQGLPLFSTPRSMFESCGILYGAGARPACSH